MYAHTYKIGIKSLSFPQNEKREKKERKKEKKLNEILSEKKKFVVSICKLLCYKSEVNFVMI